MKLTDLQIDRIFATLESNRIDAGEQGTRDMKLTAPQIDRIFAIMEENLIDDEVVRHWFFRAVWYLADNSGQGVSAVLSLMERKPLFVEKVENTILKNISQNREPYRLNIV